MKLRPIQLSRRIVRRVEERREHRLRAAGWYALSARSGMDAVFIGGCGRSGTSLFKEVLNRHPRLACGPETSLFGLPFYLPNMSEMWGIPISELRVMQDESSNLVCFAERFAHRFLSEESKHRWVEKTPNNVRAIGKLLTWFPNSRFVHVIRDGRDVVCSLRHHPKRRIVNGKVIPVHRNNPVSITAKRWVEDTAAGLAYRGHPRVIEVRYEALVSDPERVFSQVCGFIGEEFDPSMLAPAESHASPSRPGMNLNNPEASAGISPRSVGRWVKDLEPDERQTFVDIAGELLITLGYASDHAWTRDAKFVDH